MESGNKQSPSLELWLKDVQAYIYKLTGSSMKTAGFEFNRSSYLYKRKNKKSQDQLSIIFISQFPVNYRIGFQLEIWHPAIREVKESFMSEILNKESNLCSIILFTKDFSAREAGQEAVSHFPVYNHRDLFIVGDWLARTFQYELLPLCDQLSSVSHMDVFFEAKPDWSLDTRSGGNICTDLIVSKLIGRRDFHQRYQELMQGVQHRIENRHMGPESRQLLTLCYETIR